MLHVHLRQFTYRAIVLCVWPCLCHSEADSVPESLGRLAIPIDLAA